MDSKSFCDIQWCYSVLSQFIFRDITVSATHYVLRLESMSVLHNRFVQTIGVKCLCYYGPIKSQKQLQFCPFSLYSLPEKKKASVCQQRIQKWQPRWPWSCLCKNRSRKRWPPMAVIKLSPFPPPVPSYRSGTVNSKFT